jgi:hypothetical protein
MNDDRTAASSTVGTQDDGTRLLQPIARIRD